MRGHSSAEFIFDAEIEKNAHGIHKEALLKNKK